MNYITILARNVYFTPKSEDIFDNLLSLAKNQKVKNWIKSNLRNYIINEYPTDTTIIKYTKTLPSWVEKALRNKDTIYKINLTQKDKSIFTKYINFLNNYDKDISKISIPQLEKMITKVKTKSGGTQELISYPNGYKWVKLLTKEAYDAEGKEMQNCVSAFNMDMLLGVASLRDKNDNPHVDIEYGVTKVLQIKGKQNEPPIEKYIPYVMDFIIKLQKKQPQLVIRNFDLLPLGYFYDENKRKLLKGGYNSIPDGYQFDESFRFIKAKNVNLTKIKFSELKITDDSSIVLNDCDSNSTKILDSKVIFNKAWLSGTTDINKGTVEFNNVNYISAIQASKSDISLVNCNKIKDMMINENSKVDLENIKEIERHVTIKESLVSINNVIFNGAEIENCKINKATRLKGESYFIECEFKCDIELDGCQYVSIENPKNNIRVFGHGEDILIDSENTEIEISGKYYTVHIIGKNIKFNKSFTCESLRIHHQLNEKPKGVKEIIVYDD